MTNQPPYAQNPSTLSSASHPPVPDRTNQDADRNAHHEFARFYGGDAPRQPLVARPPSAWSRVPVVYWVALGIGAVAFVVHISYQQVHSGPDGYSCSYSDFAGFLAAGVLVVLATAGWATRASQHVAARLPVPLMSALTVLILALAFVHALRGNGTIMSPCDAKPAP